MRRHLYILVLVLFTFSCDDDSDPSRISFTVDGVRYNSSRAEAIINVKGGGLYDIIITGLRSDDFLLNINLNDKQLGTIYLENAFGLTSVPLGGTFESAECLQNTMGNVVFEELNVNTQRLNGTFEGYVCSGTQELEIVDGIIENVKVL